MDITKHLSELQDEDYRAFNCKLIPTVDPRRVIGVRTPALKQLAKELFASNQAKAFLNSLPHFYYEENNLHGYLIALQRDYSQTLALVKAFLPHIDNWATCDVLRPQSFRKNPERLIAEIPAFLASQHIYTQRFGMGMLMAHYLDEHFKPEYLEWVASVRSEEYYINMMIAWYFATALAKQYDFALPFIEKRRLAPWTHNKAIQKSLESRRIKPVQKEYLKALKVSL
ncbi:MAG: DNA alkylation repair protein [Clostridia bacterium]|nr:DNA alkylation repair protein [Clostridia bacterium]